MGVLACGRNGGEGVYPKEGAFLFLASDGPLGTVYGVCPVPGFQSIGCHYPMMLRKEALLPISTLYIYFQDYAEHFKLKPYIQFKSEVTRVEQTEDYATTGRWRVTVIQNGTESVHTFDAVMPCTGYFSMSNRPTYPGQEEYEGLIMHSNEYRGNKVFQNKTVVVVGKYKNRSNFKMKVVCRLNEIQQI